jgi:hypothetical protein
MFLFKQNDEGGYMIEQQPFERIHEAAAAIRNEMEMHQIIGCSMERRLVACI